MEPESRTFSYRTRRSTPTGQIPVEFECPWCGVTVHTWLWSLAGGGKRCPGCKSFNNGYGQSWKHVPESPERVAYRAGWDASKRTSTCDLDAAERRFEKKYGPGYGGTMFAAGWADYASDREKFTSLLEPAR
jgi:hypothetical protein